MAVPPTTSERLARVPAPGRDRRIAMHDLDIRERDPQRLRGNLGKGGLHPWPWGDDPVSTVTVLVGSTRTVAPS